MDDILWKLFKETGDIKYYLLRQSIKEKKWHMKIECVEGIVLNEMNYSESSKILRILTKEHGKIGVLSKGCRSLKSKLRGVSGKLVYGSFYIYYKENGLSTLISVDVKNSFINLRSDLTKISYAAYLCELVDQVSNQTSDGSIYDVFSNALIKMEENFSPRILTNIVELKMLDYLGVKPMLDGCAYCGNTKNIITLSSSAGGFVCQNCYSNEKIVNSDVISFLRMFYYVDIAKISKLSIKDDIMRIIDEFIDEYYERYTGLYLKSKKFLHNLNKITPKNWRIGHNWLQ